MSRRSLPLSPRLTLRSHSLTRSPTERLLNLLSNFHDPKNEQQWIHYVTHLLTSLAT